MTSTVEKALPILSAAFPESLDVRSLTEALEQRRIGRDFIGVLVSEDGARSNGHAVLCMVSVLAPFRLHDEVRAVFESLGAFDVDGPLEIKARYGVAAHPGVIEDRSLKLGMGLEYWQAVNGRKNRKNGK